MFQPIFQFHSLNQVDVPEVSDNPVEENTSEGKGINRTVALCLVSLLLFNMSAIKQRRLEGEILLCFVCFHLPGILERQVLMKDMINVVMKLFK